MPGLGRKTRLTRRVPSHPRRTLRAEPKRSFFQRRTRLAGPKRVLLHPRTPVAETKRVLLHSAKAGSYCRASAAPFGSSNSYAWREFCTATGRGCVYGAFHVEGIARVRPGEYSDRVV